MENIKKILLVDDESDFVDACARTFGAKAYQVVTCSRPEVEEKMKEEPDIIVLGTMSPSGEAFRLHQWLKGHPRYRDIPLVVIDAREEERPIRGWRREEGCFAWQLSISSLLRNSRYGSLQWNWLTMHSLFLRSCVLASTFVSSVRWRLP